MTDCKMVLPMSLFDAKIDRPLFTSGQGIWLTDENGKRYLDAISGMWNVSFGYGNKTIIEAIKNQTDKLPFSNLYTSPADVTVIYANKLIQCLHGCFERLIYTCTGSESVELAMKICRKYQSLFKNSKREIGVLNYSYHGTTYGAMSLSGIDQELIKDYLPAVKDIEWINIPCDDIANAESWIKTFSEFFKFHADSLAGIVVEPIIGSGGVIEIPTEAMISLEKLCDENGVLFVVDEVATGFGRTGKMFAFEHSGVTPDVMCVSKCINSGYVPMGAVLVNEKVSHKFIEQGAFIEHFSTQNGNPIACSAAIAVLNLLISDNGIMEDISKKGDYLYNGLINKINLKNISVDIRYKGLMLAIDLKRKVGNLPVSENELGNCINKLFKKGILVHAYYNKGKNSGFMLLPSFTIDYNELDMITDKIFKTLYSC